ncbi:MAG: ECF-type sigma factor [Phycisphaerales bacterium JB037]
MTSEPTDGVTHLLRRLDEGHAGAFNDLVDHVYDRIRAIAHNRRRQRFGDQARQLTEQTTELANRVLMEFQQQRETPGNTEHFFAIATRLLMLRMTDYQRARLALKRGGGNRGNASVDGAAAAVGTPGTREAADAFEEDRVRQALEKLHEADARKAEVVTLHLWRGLPLPEVAERVEVSLPTAERDWRAAKAWLAAELA